ncbi:MAG: hypothetical protein Q4B52_05835 [Tissierellia bacterium]|nr:hypothetical protein [Tissierellia bacterium]
MANEKTKEIWKKASKKWAKNNPEHKKYLSYRSTSLTFARHHANDRDSLLL